MNVNTSRRVILLTHSLRISHQRPITKTIILQIRNSSSSPSPPSPSPSPLKASAYQTTTSSTLRPNSPFNPAYNPPDSTRPPPLILPTRTPESSAITHYIKLGKVYVSFYRAGLRSIWTNHKTSRDIKKRMSKCEVIMQKGTPEEQAAMSAQYPWQTRAEFQVLMRSQHDKKKLPLFLGLFAVTFEFFPAVVYLLRNVLSDKLPYTVRQPGQVDIVRDQAAERWRRVTEKYGGRDSGSMEFLEYVMYTVEFHGLGVKVLPLNWHPWFLLMARARRKAEYLRWDDLMIGHNGVEGLMDEEVVFSAVERGIWDADTGMNDLRHRLQKSVNSTIEMENRFKREAKKEQQAQEKAARRL